MPLIDDEILEWSVWHPCANPFAQPFDSCINPIHRVLTDVEGAEEHEVHEQQENGVAPHLMGDHSIDAFGHEPLVFVYLLEGLFHGSLHIAILGVCDSGLAVFANLAEHIFLADVTLGKDFIGIFTEYFSKY